MEKNNKVIEKNTVVFVGNYSVGKSSLINFILGEEKAEVDELETTQNLTPYKWEHLTLMDLPGLNTKNHKIEEYEYLIRDACCVLIVDVPSSVQSNQSAEYYAKCVEYRNYNDKNIHFVINRFDELSSKNIKIIEELLQKKDKKGLIYFLDAKRGEERFPNNSLKDMLKNLNEIEWIHNQISAKILKENIVPYNILMREYQNFNSDVINALKECALPKSINNIEGTKKSALINVNLEELVFIYRNLPTLSRIVFDKSILENTDVDYLTISINDKWYFVELYFRNSKPYIINAVKFKPDEEILAAKKKIILNEKVKTLTENYNKICEEKEKNEKELKLNLREEIQEKQQLKNKLEKEERQFCIIS